MKDCLISLGVDEQTADLIEEYNHNHNHEEVINLLRKERCKFLSELHETSKKIECIDYLIHQAKENK